MDTSEFDQQAHTHLNTYHAFMNGARAAGISGSGPAIVIVIPSSSEPTVQRLEAWYQQRAPDRSLLRTTFVG